MPPAHPISYGVIFDLDGVLIDSAQCHELSWHQFALKYGRDFSSALFRKTFGMPNALILQHLFPERKLSPEELIELSEEKEIIFRDLARDSIHWLPGAKELLNSLKNRHEFVLTLYTSTPRSNVDFLNKILGLNHFFTIVLSANDVTCGKPDPEGFILALERMNLSPQQAVVIEDSPAGIHAAHLAGIRVIALTTTHPREMLQEADIIVPDLRSLTPDYILDIIRI